MTITATFNNGALTVFEDERQIIYQPFRPTATGEQPAWTDEAEALAYWDSIKSNFGNIA